MKSTTWSTGLSFSADGTGVVAHAGNVATRLLADQVGPTGALSEAMARRGFTPTHDRGRVLVDVATLIAGGGEAIADIDVLRHQGEVLGSVASASTVWRALDEITPAVVKRIEKARAKVRAHVWSQLEARDGFPASKVADTDRGDVVVLDVDATLVTTHSEKEGAAVDVQEWLRLPPRWACGARTPRSPSPCCCGRGTQARTPRPTTSPS